MLTKEYKKYAAELIGTFTLVLAVTLTFEYGVVAPAPVVAALTLGFFVYVIGGLSGCHINPAVTIGLFGIGKISFSESVRYVIAQLAGVVLAVLLRMLLSGDFPILENDIALSEWAAEFLGAAVLTFGVTAVALGKVEKAASGIVIGSALFIGILIASPFSFGILNPAVAIGFYIFSPPYIVGPVLGGLCGAYLCHSLHRK